MRPYGGKGICSQKMVFERGWWFVVIIVTCTCGAHGAHAANASEALLRPRCPPSPADCHDNDHSRDEHFYTVRGKDIRIKFAATEYFNIDCVENLTLEDTSLPRFELNLSVALVTLRNCMPPEKGYACALAKIGVVHFERLTLDNMPARPPLRAAHFTALPALHTLALSSTKLAALPELAFLAPLTNLHSLRIERVPLEPPTLVALPTTLRLLQLRDCRLEALPAAALARLPALAQLILRDSELRAAPELAAAPALRDVFLALPLAQPPSLAHFENVTLWNVSRWELRAEMWGECGKLRRLSVAASSRLTLPVGWLAACTRLDWLELSQASLTGGALPARMVAGARALRSLTVRSCGLAMLPPDLLSDAVELTELNLSYNTLEDLPSQMFFHLRALRSLDLSHNKLTARALPALGSLTRLHNLVLDYNPLGDLCPAGSGNVYAADAESPLAKLRALNQLSLMATGVVRLCADWRRALRDLATLDLSHNALRVLYLDELRFERRVKASVDLRRNPLRTLHYSRDDYAAVLTLDPKVTIILDAELKCDCDTYWAARALRERPADATLAGLLCAGEPPEPLVTVPLERMTCALPAAQCAPGCMCAWRADLGATGAAVARCAGAGLARAPRTPATAPPPAELYLARNRIRELRADDIDNRTSFVDLSFNELSHISVEAMRALMSGERRVQLRGNPLACECADRAALDVLRAARRHVSDYDELTCADGEPLRDAEPCRARDLLVPLAGVAVASLAALIAGALCWQQRGMLFVRLKAALLARGLCLRWLPRPAAAGNAADAADADENKKYDVFVSFSHHDERFVSSQLVARLESGPRPLRACVHYRDWAPGSWIPDQIAASVRDSRRTVLVVSEHFAASPWARAEFRAAHASALRGAVAPVVVLLPGVRRDALEPALRAYLAANTYVEWGDPWFWDKLYNALPHPRAAAAPAAADDTRKATELKISAAALRILAEPAAPSA